VASSLGQRERELTLGWKKMHNEELHNSYSLPDIISVIKSRRIKWAGHAACIV
jgi:hypothetical protein